MNKSKEIDTDELRIKLEITINKDLNPNNYDATRYLIDEWFSTPTDKLNYRTPNQAIKDGDYDEVRDLIDEIYSSQVFY